MVFIRILELFSGYGTATFALKKAGIEHKVVGYSDIEKPANYIYPLNHGQEIPQLGDVRKIDPDKLEDFDLLTGGFPCQSFSLAGKREGFEAKDKGNLFFEIIRIAKAKKPRWMLLENVEGILSHDDGYTFRRVLHELALAGYYVQWKKMYSKDHGTPQNRPRVWFACFREEEDSMKFAFPESEELKITVKDLLEDNVDKKYYLTQKQLDKFNESTRYGNHSLDYGDEIHPTLCSIGQSDVAIIPKDFKIRDNYNDKEVDEIGTLGTNCGTVTGTGSFLIADFRNDTGASIRTDEICHTLTSRKHSATDISTSPPMIAEWRNDTGLKINKDNNVMNTLTAGMGTGGGNIPMIADYRSDEGLRPRKDGIAPTLVSSGQSDKTMGRMAPFVKVSPTLTTELSHSTGNTFDAAQFKKLTGEWRRLTPRECFRLMGFFDDEIKFGDLSDSKLYFLAGNGQDVNVVTKIFKQMFFGNTNKQKGIFDY